MLESSKELNLHVGQKLREFRQASGLSKAQIARKLGYAQNVVDQIEEGKHSVTADELWDMCIVLEVSPSAFFPEID